MTDAEYTVQAIAKREGGPDVIQLRPKQGDGLDSIRLPRGHGLRPGDRVVVQVQIRPPKTGPA